MTNVIKLNSEEISGLQRLARWRSDPKVDVYCNYMSKTDYSRQKEKSYQFHYLGIVGEFAVARYLGAFFDPIPRMKGDGHKSDVVWGGNAKIAVKTTKYKPPIYKIEKLKEIEDATDLALCYYKEPFLEISWIKDKKEFLDNMYIDDFGYGNRYCLKE